jgi:predicted transcriptional regulator
VSRIGLTSRKTVPDISTSGGYTYPTSSEPGEASRAAQDSRRRDETTVIYDILALTSLEPANKTRIVYRCNLNFVKAQRLVDELIAASLLAEDRSGSKLRYRTTPQGANYLREFEILRALRSGAHV